MVSCIYQLDTLWQNFKGILSHNAWFFDGCVLFLILGSLIFSVMLSSTFDRCWCINILFFFEGNIIKSFLAPSLFFPFFQENSIFVSFLIMRVSFISFLAFHGIVSYHMSIAWIIHLYLSTVWSDFKISKAHCFAYFH